MDQPRILYVTTENSEEARRIGEMLVKQKLCACVNILNGMESMYLWDGKVQTDTECVLLIKTTAVSVQAVIDAVIEHHNYDVPCVISLPLSANEGNPEYLHWIKESVSTQNL